MHAFRRSLVCAVLALASGFAWAQNLVVYHFDDSELQALRGLRSMRNHLDIDPTAKITAVAIGSGVDFLLEGAKHPGGTEYAPLVSALVSRGVNFEICEITLRGRDLKKDLFIQEATFTPSGVVRVAKLQQQGAAYLKP